MLDVYRHYWYVFESSLVGNKARADLTDTAMGIAFLYENTRPASLALSSSFINKYYISISHALDTLVTVIIVTRLIMHSRNIRKAIGASTGTNGLYKTVVAMLVESYALYAVAFLLFIIPRASNNPVVNIFFPILVLSRVRVISTLPWHRNPGVRFSNHRDE
jgi:hypothetical protein